MKNKQTSGFKSGLYNCQRHEREPDFLSRNISLKVSQTNMLMLYRWAAARKSTLVAHLSRSEAELAGSFAALQWISASL
jgi:hypothetical protein